MAGTLTDAKIVVGEAEVQPSVSQSTWAERARARLANRVPTAYRLIDEQGCCAYVWWEERGVVVEAEDAAFRRRVVRALKKPIRTIEDVPDEQGFPLTTRVRLRPDDPRYPSRLFFRWNQVGLGDLAEVEVVRLDNRQPVETLLTLLNQASREERAGVTGIEPPSLRTQEHAEMPRR